MTSDIANCGKCIPRFFFSVTNIYMKSWIFATLWHKPVRDKTAVISHGTTQNSTYSQCAIVYYCSSVTCRLSMGVSKLSNNTIKYLPIYMPVVAGIGIFPINPRFFLTGLGRNRVLMYKILSPVDDHDWKKRNVYDDIPLGQIRSNMSAAFIKLHGTDDNVPHKKTSPHHIQNLPQYILCVSFAERCPALIQG